MDFDMDFAMDLDSAIIEAIEKGWVEVYDDPNGEVIVSLTPEGYRFADELKQSRAREIAREIAQTI